MRDSLYKCGLKSYLTMIIKILITTAKVLVTSNNDTIIEKREELKFTFTLTINKTQFC